MKTIRLLLTMIILLAGFTGCVKDRGDYDYTDIPVFSTDDWQVKVNDKVAELRADNKIVLKTGDRLCIAANGGFTGNARPEYHWKVLTKDQPDNPEHIFESPREVAVTKDFDQAFEEGPGSYILSFEAINRNNNTIFGAQFIVEVLSTKVCSSIMPMLTVKEIIVLLPQRKSCLALMRIIWAGTIIFIRP